MAGPTGVIAVTGASSNADVGHGEPVVEFRRVSKSYDGATLAIRDLELQTRRGEFITLLGPSGSGKTTSLMLLAGFEFPTAGDILFAGQSITRLPPHKRNFGVVFQGYALFPHMSVLENVAYPLRMRKVAQSKAFAQASRALEMVRLTGFEDRRPAQLSGGQQQRVALARALVFEPYVVLMDEPLGALDKNLREQMQLEIRHLHERLKNTIVYVTHDQTEALVMSDRIAVFNHGELQQCAAPEELYRCPLNSFIAQFIGESNQLHGVVVKVEEGSCLIRLDSGQEVHATPGRGTVAGQRTTLSLRPEHVTLNAMEPGNVNHFRGVVREVIYVGDQNRCSIELDGGASFVLKLPNDKRARRLNRNEVVEVSWSSRDCLALDPLD